MRRHAVAEVVLLTVVARLQLLRCLLAVGEVSPHGTSAIAVGEVERPGLSWHHRHSFGHGFVPRVD